MRHTSAVAVLAAALLGGCSAFPGYDLGPDRAVAAAVAAGVAGPARPEADRARDAARKPAEVLAFAGVRPGWRVGEYMPGGGYFTRILSGAVGPDGRVYAFQPAEIVKLAPKYLTDLQAVAAEPAHANVAVISEPTRAFGAPEPLDLVFTAQNYHDLHGRFAAPGTAEAFNAAVFRALKPGGIYLVVDHAAPGVDTSAAAALHRIDPAKVKAEIVAAGFVYEGETAVLRNPADDPAKSVFDPAVRGGTDQFVYRFRKPDR